MPHTTPPVVCYVGLQGGLHAQADLHGTQLTNDRLAVTCPVCLTLLAPTSFRDVQVVRTTKPECHERDHHIPSPIKVGSTCACGSVKIVAEVPNPAATDADQTPE